MRYIGIDPGLSGAVAFIGDDFECVEDAPSVEVKKGNDYLIGSMVELLRAHGADRPALAVLEAGLAMPRQSSSTTAKQARGGGLWEGMLAALDIPYVTVRPNIWKKYMGVTSDKGEARVMAQKLFPQLSDRLARVKDDGRAEALLLAEYARRTAAR